MTVENFKASLNSASPPKDISVYLTALWHDAKNNWVAAHDLINDLQGKDAAWVHAYLHRKEGDQWNAQYWYNRAQKPVFRLSLDEEWNQLVDYFCD